MLDTRPIHDTALRCEALLDRVAATPIGANAHTLKVVLAECDLLEHSLRNPSDICKVREARHWLRLAYGTVLHGYPPDELRRCTLAALMGVQAAHRRNA